MQLRKTSHRTKYPQGGFTLIEIMIGIGILAVVLSLGLFVSMDFYRGYSQNYEENLVVGIIQRARSQAMANVNQVKHGACYDESRKKYVLYTNAIGDSCTNSTTIFDKANSASVSWSTPIIFNQLDGTCSACPLTVTMSSPGKASVSININNEGRIDW